MPNVLILSPPTILGQRAGPGTEPERFGGRSGVAGLRIQRFAEPSLPLPPVHPSESPAPLHPHPRPHPHPHPQSQPHHAGARVSPYPSPHVTQGSSVRVESRWSQRFSCKMWEIQFRTAILLSRNGQARLGEGGRSRPLGHPRRCIGPLPPQPVHSRLSSSLHTTPTSFISNAGGLPVPITVSGMGARCARPPPSIPGNPAAAPAWSSPEVARAWVPPRASPPCECAKTGSGLN